MNCSRIFRRTISVHKNFLNKKIYPIKYNNNLWIKRRRSSSLTESYKNYSTTSFNMLFSVGFLFGAINEYYILEKSNKMKIETNTKHGIYYDTIISGLLVGIICTCRVPVIQCIFFPFYIHNIYIRNKIIKNRKQKYE